MAEHHAADAAQDRAAGDHDEGELEVVHDDLAVGEAEGLQDGDLLPLQVQQAGEHGVGHEGGHAEEHHGKPIESVVSTRISSETRMCEGDRRGRRRPARRRASAGGPARR